MSKAAMASGKGGVQAARYAMAYLFIAPIVIGTVVFILGPMLVSFWWSFTDYNGIAAPRFVGFRNYLNLFTDYKFLASLKNTSFFVLASMVVGPALGLGTAMLLNAKVKMQGLFRTAYFLPVMASSIVVAMVWRLIYNANGILNFIIVSLGGEPVMWLSDPRIVMISITVASVWQGFGFETVVFLAALQSIPKELYEAATLDGAGLWQRFLHVTLPALKPVLFFVFCVGIIGAFQVFDLPYSIMKSQANPGPEYATLVYYLFAKFRDLRLGQASAIAYILFVVLIVVSFVQWRMNKKEERP